MRNSNAPSRGSITTPPPDTSGGSPAPSLTTLLGRARAAALCAAAVGATSASGHATALRDAGLITSRPKASGA